VAGSVLTATGVLGQTFAVTGTGNASNLASKDVQTGSLLASVTGLSLGASGNGGLASNYNVLGTAGSSIDITKANLVLSGTRTYDGTTVVAGGRSAPVASTAKHSPWPGRGMRAISRVKTCKPGRRWPRSPASRSARAATAAWPATTNTISTTGSSYTINKADLALSGSRAYDGTTAIAAACSPPAASTARLSH
jgi:hypothetical protein